jgi:hypothetical protein
LLYGKHLVQARRCSNAVLADKRNPAGAGGEGHGETETRILAARITST